MNTTNELTPYERVRRVKQAHERELLKKPNVVGIGVGFRYQRGQRTDILAVVVMVRHKFPSDELDPNARIPSEIDGVPVDVLEVGSIVAQ